MRNKNNNFVVNMNKDGELVQEYLHDFTKDKYKADSPFLWGIVPYILMAICIIIDISFFYSLFSRISYDNPEMIFLEVIGMAFSADIVAAYAGILAKQLSQGLSRNKERWNLYLLLSVTVLALVTNAILRIMTISLSSAEGNIDAATIASTTFAIVMPVCTSIGNFAINFQTYNPLKVKFFREEVAIDEVGDYCRRLRAIKEECDNFSEERMKELDRKQLDNAKKELISDAFNLYADTKVKLMEHLGNPTSTNILSRSGCEEIFKRLNEELNAMGVIDIKENSKKLLLEQENAVSSIETAQGGMEDEE